jgi:hypothetical protein
VCEVALNSLWWEQSISGTIMLDETLLRSSPAAGVPFVDILEEPGILPGMKVDTGLQPIDGTDGETSTQGLDGLAKRCKRSVHFLLLFWRTITQVCLRSIHAQRKFVLYFLPANNTILCQFPCVDEIEVLVHMVYNNLLKSVPM